MAASMVQASCICCRKYLTLPHQIFLRSLSNVVTTANENLQPTTPQAVKDTTITIKIPKKKKRDSLSILQALADTVKRDDVGPRYKYIDDPFLHPTTMVDQKSFALSKASGQKAAKYIIESFPRLFEPSKAEPHIEAYQPKSGSYKHEEATEEGLMERISRRQVTAAYESYQKIQKNGGSLSQSAYNDLLDLLCAYNCEEPPPPLTPDELYYRRDAQADASKTSPSWQTGCTAEIVFADMMEKNARAYNAMVRAMAKFSERDKAVEMYEQMKQKDLAVDLGTYNELLRSLSIQSAKVQEKWTNVEVLLTEMSKCGVHPDLGTFNAVLQVLMKHSRDRHSAKRAVNTIAEMIKLGIEPSLATWNQLLRIIYVDPTTQHNIIYEVMDYIKGKTFTLQDPADFDFFGTAMVKCNVNLKDLSLAHKVNDLLYTGDNIGFLGDGVITNLYHTHYMQLISTFDELSSVIDFYEKNVPHMWVPTYRDLEEFLKTIELNEGYYYLPQVWSDIHMLKYTFSTEITERLVHIMAKVKHQKELQTKFAEAADEIFSNLTVQSKLPRPVKVLSPTGTMLGNMIMIYLNSEMLDKAWDCFELYNKKKQKMSGFPNESTLTTLTKKCMETGKIKEAIKSVSLMADLAYPTADALIKELTSHPNLTDEQRDQLHDL